MRIDHPLYKGLPVCKGNSDDEIDSLTKQEYQRNPKLAFFPVIAWLIVFPIAILAPRLISLFTYVDKIWSIVIAGLLFCVPFYLFEKIFHLPLVNREMEGLVAELLDRETTQGNAPGASP